MRSGCREGEVEALGGEDLLMERGAGGVGVDLVELCVIALDVGLIVDRAEKLAEVIAGKIGVDDLDGARRKLAAQMAEHLAPHSHRGATVRAAHIGDAHPRAVIGELHSIDGADDQGNGEIDDVARAGRRLGIIARALHGHEAGGFVHRHLAS